MEVRGRKIHVISHSGVIHSIRMCLFCKNCVHREGSNQSEDGWKPGHPARNPNPIMAVWKHIENISQNLVKFSLQNCY